MNDVGNMEKQDINTIDDAVINFAEVFFIL